MFRFRFHKRHGRNGKCAVGPAHQDCSKYASQCTLADIPPGKQAKISNFCDGISKDRAAHLLAYGLSPGYTVKVLQHVPVTVVRVEHTELAMELDLACEILVEPEIHENFN
jgi:Fe2+ transport system protein FeoA